MLDVYKNISYKKPSDNGTLAIFADCDIWSDGKIPLSLSSGHVIKHSLVSDTVCPHTAFQWCV